MLWKTLTLLTLLIVDSSCLGESPVETIKQWNLLNFNFPYDWPVNDKTLYNPENVVATGFEIGDNRIFIANPRLFSGVPATISSVSRDAVGDSPVLQVKKISKSFATNTHVLASSRLGISRLVTPHSRSQAIQLQWNWTDIGLPIENWFMQSALGRRCGRFEIAWRLWNYVPAQNSRLRSEYWFGCAKVCFPTLFWFDWVVRRKAKKAEQSNFSRARYNKFSLFLFSYLKRESPPTPSTNQTSRIDFPKEVIRKESLFTNIIIDETTSLPENNCDDVVVYISDTVEPGNWKSILRRGIFNDEEVAKTIINNQWLVTHQNCRWNFGETFPMIMNKSSFIFCNLH